MEQAQLAPRTVVISRNSLNSATQIKILTSQLSTILPIAIVGIGAVAGVVIYRARKKRKKKAAAT
jgi:phosphotransferase system  glucose/maltose/N-acetylglucosamine-specific IIC component